MAVTTTIPNAVPTLALEEGVIGSQIKIAVYFERLVSENPNVFEPFDFTGMTLKAEIKDKVKELPADAEFTCTPRVLEPGWVDLYLGGDVTSTLLAKTYFASLKVWPTGQASKGDTLVVITIPMKYAATR
jgi:hypothetical protein